MVVVATAVDVVFTDAGPGTGTGTVGGTVTNPSPGSPHATRTIPATSHQRLELLEFLEFLTVYWAHRDPPTGNINPPRLYVKAVGL